MIEEGPDFNFLITVALVCTQKGSQDIAAKFALETSKYFEWICQLSALHSWIRAFG